MIRMLVVFFVVFLLVHFGIQGWRAAQSETRWALAKSLTYSLVVAIITVVAISLLVIFF